MDKNRGDDIRRRRGRIGAATPRELSQGCRGGVGQATSRWRRRRGGGGGVDGDGGVVVGGRRRRGEGFDRESAVPTSYDMTLGASLATFRRFPYKSGRSQDKIRGGTAARGI